VHDDGKVIARGRDVATLRGTAANGLLTDAPAATRELGRQAAEWGREGITSWDFGDLPEEVTIERAGIQMRAWPALIDDGRSVSMRALDSHHAAERATRAGIRRLIMLRFPDEMRYLADQLPGWQAMSLDAAAMGIDGASLRDMLLHRIIDTSFLPDGKTVRNAAAFEARISGGWHNLQDATERTCAVVGRALRARHALEEMLCDLRAPLFAEPRHEIAEHLAHLLPDTFVIDAPGEWFERLPRYLSAVQLRIEKLSNGKLARDRQLAAEIEPLWRQCLQRQDSHRRQGIDDPELELYRWMLEELRVSLFAQELGAAIRISRKRLDEQWRRVAP
jgi:ATP-dependent helicase HrpA